MIEKYLRKLFVSRRVFLTAESSALTVVPPAVVPEIKKYFNRNMWEKSKVNQYLEKDFETQN